MTLKQFKLELEKLDDSLEVLGHSRLAGGGGAIYKVEETEVFPQFQGSPPAELPTRFILLTMF